MPVCFCAGPFILVVGLFLLAIGIRRHQLYQKIADTPTSKVRSAAVGLVELSGKARCRDDVLSPISKVRSAFWRVTGEYYYHTKHGGGWSQFFRRESGVPFYLEDATGKMLVDPVGGSVELPYDFRAAGFMTEFNLFGFHLRDKMEPKVLAFIESDPGIHSSFRRYSGRRLRITEYYIAEGDPLYVLGSATPVEKASEVAQENLVVKKSPLDGILFISDSGEKSITANMRWVMLALIGFGVLFTAMGLMVSVASLGLLAFLPL